MFDYSHGTSKTLIFDLPPLFFPSYTKILEITFQILTPFLVEKWMLSSYKFMDNEKIEKNSRSAEESRNANFQGRLWIYFKSMNHRKVFGA